MNLRSLPFVNQLAIVSINFIVLALILTVINHNRLKDKESRTFFFMSIFMLIWVDFAYAARIFGNIPEYSEVFLKIAWTATPFLFYTTYLTSNFLMERKLNLYINYGLLAVTLVLGLSAAIGDHIIAGLTFTNSILDIVYGDFFPAFMIGIFLLMVGTLAPLIKKRPSKKVTAFLIGVIIFYVFNLIFNIFLPVFMGITHLYFLGDYSTIFLLSFTTYAVLRHELFDVRVFAAELLTVLIWSILFAKVLFARDFSEVTMDLVVLLIMVVFGILLIRSVTKEVKQKEELERLTKKLKHMDEVKNEFISVAAHELRAPLTAIKGYLSLILDGDAGKITAQAREFLQDSALSNERMIRLVNNMLDVGRIEEGRIVYQEGYANVSELVQQAYSEFKLESEHKGLDLKVELGKALHDRVFVDPDRLHEVIVNFLSNALKYTETGWVSLRVVNPRAGWVRAEVSDSGVGITEPEQKKLFRKFYRVSSEAGKTIGSGLGLYVSKLLIERFGGQIGVESEYGKGSTFWFELPVDRGNSSINKEDGAKQKDSSDR